MKKDRGEAAERRDEAIELMGRWLYDDLWLGELNTLDWKIGQRYELEPGKRFVAPLSLSTDPKEAARNARAYFRSLASAFQYDQVWHWLQHDLGIDCTVARFDRAKFDAWYGEKIGPLPSTTTEARKAAVERVLRRVGRPGRGGSMPWVPFCGLVRDDCGQNCDDRTIKDDVKEILKRYPQIGNLGNSP